MDAIAFNHLTKQYGKSRGVMDVDFKVEEGEIFGFIGPNGAGKSTSIRTLLGLIRPTSGGAEIFGKSCVKNPEIRAQVGYLPSEVFYYDNMRVIDLLNYSASFYHKDCTQRIRELAGSMNLDLKKKIDDLSFGNKKKVGIVQGLLHDPKLIILDEPTSGLDPLMQQTFFELLRGENEKGVTIFFSSHILSEVQKMCSRVAFIKEGRIIRLEKMSDLKENNCKRIRIESPGIPAELLASLDGVSSPERSGDTLSFLYRGDINQVIARLAGIHVANLSVEEPDLEEIFLHYYAKEG